MSIGSNLKTARILSSTQPAQTVFILDTLDEAGIHYVLVDRDPAAAGFGGMQTTEFHVLRDELVQVRTLMRAAVADLPHRRDLIAQLDQAEQIPPDDSPAPIGWPGSESSRLVLSLAALFVVLFVVLVLAMNL